MFKLSNRISLAKVIAILFAVSPFVALGFISDTEAVTKFNIKIEPSIELTVSNTSPSVRFESPDGEIHQAAIGTTVTTNNPTGYTMALLMNNENLINRNNPDYVIPSLENSTLAANFANNRWGILGSNDLYYPIFSGYKVKTTDTPVTNDAETITFGVKINSELPSGTYDCDLTVVAIANRIPYTIDIIDYLQEIDEDVIDSMVVGTQYQLMDKRDDKKYFISKLKDGKVWMTENLDLTLSAEGTVLDPDTSDVNSTKTVTVSTNAATWGVDDTLAFYKDAGDLYRPNGLDAATDSSSLASDSSDRHYLLGSYYSWNAATAGSGSNASESICPSSWRLPTSEDFDTLYRKIAERYSHTSNINDNGVQNGDYGNNLNTPAEVITIPGATKLHIKLTYAGQSDSYDWVSFWAGNYPNYTASNNYSSGVKFGNNTTGKYGGYSGTTVEGDISGDTVTFSFRSNDSGVGNGYGYYAVITGYDANDELIIGDTNTVLLSTPYFMNYAGQFDGTNDWTTSPRSAGYWSASTAGNGQAHAFTMQETINGNDSTFSNNPNDSVNITNGLNVRCVAKPASFSF